MLSNILTIIIFVVLFNNIPIFIENRKRNDVSKKYILCWGGVAFIISALSLWLIHLPFNSSTVLTIGITDIIGIILNLSYRGNLKRQKLCERSLLVLFLFFFSSLFQIIPITILQIDISSISGELDSYMSLFSNYCLLLILLFLYSKDLKEEFKIFTKNKMKNMDIGLKYWILGLIIMIIGNTLILFLLPKASAGNEQAVQEMIHAAPFISLISTGLLAPLIEEITFRKAFRDMIPNDRIFVLVSGIVFGSLHVVLTLNSIFDLAYLIPYCALGIAFGMIYAKTKTIFTSISIHMIHNIALTLISIISILVILC